MLCLWVRSSALFSFCTESDLTCFAPATCAIKIICDELGLAERTVKAHGTEVLRALGVFSRTQAALAAARLGLGGTLTQPARQRAGAEPVAGHWRSGPCRCRRSSRPCADS